MNRKSIKFIIIAFAYLAVLFPVWMRIKNLSWALDSTLASNLFPVFGLVALSLLWLHVISGVFEPWLRTLFDFDKFVRRTTIVIFVCIILHPLLLFLYLDFDLNKILGYGDKKYIRLGVIAWFLLITYDLGKLLQKKSDFFVRNWNKILFVSTIGILIAFIHSLSLGSDLQSGPLRTVWLFYGTTAVLATIYNFGIKRSLKRVH